MTDISIGLAESFCLIVCTIAVRRGPLMKQKNNAAEAKGCV